jgi:cytochrome c-type biogenesis protein CcmF
LLLDIQEGTATRQVSLRMKAAGGSVEFPVTTYSARSGGAYEFRIARLRPDQDEKAAPSVELVVRTPSDRSVIGKPETLVVEASVKPFINLVWVGTVTLVVGFFLTILRRVQESKLKNEEEPEHDAP